MSVEESVVNSSMDSNNSMCNSVSSIKEAGNISNASLNNSQGSVGSKITQLKIDEMFAARAESDNKKEAEQIIQVYTTTMQITPVSSQTNSPVRPPNKGFKSSAADGLMSQSN